MEMTFPFFSNHPDDAGASIYHTHPRCRVAQRISLGSRILGTGESRGECPFCYLLAQFQANRGLRGHLLSELPVVAGAGSADAAARPLRALRLCH